MNSVVSLLTGLALGVMLHRSRFCVAAGFRDLLLFRDTGPARGILTALSVATPLFALLQARAMAAGAPLPGRFGPVGPALLAGAFLFGVGMIPASGCACSTLLRSGEGHLRFLWVLLGIAAGSLLGAAHWGWWMARQPATAAAVHLPSVLGWGPALALQGALLLLLYRLLRRAEVTTQ